jgi:hypothetical protein
MSQVKLLKIAADGVPLEMDTANDDVTLHSYTVTGGGPVLSGTGLNLNTQPISGLTNITFVDPTSDHINQTAGNLIVDDIMAKERSNVMTTAADILFPVISDAAGQVDSFRVPALAGAPSATPTNAGAGYLVYNSSEPSLWAWTGSAWQDVALATTAQAIENLYSVDTDGVTANDVVYISAADKVSPAKADTATHAQAIGFAKTTQVADDTVEVRSSGVLGGFTSLTAGARYYLDETTAGAISASVPTGSGHTIVQVGYAKNATDLQIQIQSLGRRA